MTTAVRPAASGSRRALAVLFVLACLLLGVRIGMAPVDRESEVRCHETAQHVLESGDWAVPVFEGKPRVEKPPLYTWLAAVSGSVFGMDQVGVRVPSALAGLALLAVLYAWGRSLGGDVRGPPLGAVAAGLLLTMALFATQARRGDAEMLLAAAICAAWLAYDAVRFRGRRDLAWVFAACLALALLVKAHAGLFAIALPIVADLALARRLRDLVRPRVLAWCAAALAVGIAWFVYIAVAVPGAREILRDEILKPITGRRATGSTHHVRPFWWYAPQFLTGIAPAVLLLPFAAVRARATRWYAETPRVRFVALCVVTVLVGFSCLSGKQRHYVLPAVAPAALLLADAVVAAADRPRRSFVVGACAALVVGAAAVFGSFGWIERLPPWTWGPPALAAIAAACVLAVRGRRSSAAVLAWSALGGTFLLLTAYHWSFEPIRTIFDVEGRAGLPPALRTELEPRLASDERLARLLHADEPSEAEREAEAERRRAERRERRQLQDDAPPAPPPDRQ